jgi:hypothetical protein
MALLTGNNEMSTNISSMPPAMPTMPDSTLVAKALSVINAQIMGDVIMSTVSSIFIYEKSDEVEYD